MAIDKLYVDYKQIASTIILDWENEVNRARALGDDYAPAVLKDQFPMAPDDKKQDILDHIKKDFDIQGQNVDFLKSFLITNLNLAQTEPICLVQKDHTWYLNAWHLRYSYRDTWVYEKNQLVPNKSYEFVWLYQDTIWGINSFYTQDEQKLLILEYADKERRKFEKLKNKFSGKSPEELKYERARLPEEVRIAVWRRDQGRYASCGSRENLEYDHIVPVSKGGGNTERNVELLCQNCNRSKGNRIE